MRTKMRLFARCVLLGTTLSSFLVGAESKKIVIQPRAQLRIPEKIFLPSSSTLIRSNDTEEFTPLDADSSLVLEPAFCDNSASVLIQEGVVLPLKNQGQGIATEESLFQMVPENQSGLSEALSAEVSLNSDLLLSDSSADAEDEADALLESQWIINPQESEEYLSVDSREAKSLLEYVKKTCADPSATVRMSLNGRDVLAFLTMARRYKFDALAIDTGLRCFYNKFKSCAVIDDAVLHQILPALAGLLEEHLDYEKNVSMSISSVQRDVEQLMCECFVKYSHMLSSRPNDFLTKLSRMVARSAYMSLESDETALARSRHDRERLRVLAVQFINLLLDRVVWPPHAFESIWPSFIRIGSYVCDFAQKNVITHMDDFKDLYSTLTQRFIFYINLHAAMLPSDFFRVVQNDLSMGAVFFLEYDVHADLKKTFERELNVALMRSLAYEQSGLIS